MHRRFKDKKDTDHSRHKERPRLFGCQCDIDKKEHAPERKVVWGEG